MEKAIDFWLRTEGTAESVVPTIDSLEDFNEPVGTEGSVSVRKCRTRVPLHSQTGLKQAQFAE